MSRVGACSLRSGLFLCGVCGKAPAQSLVIGCDEARSGEGDACSIGKCLTIDFVLLFVY